MENSAGKPVVDASFSACKTFTGRTGCGWSDHILVTCKRGDLGKFQCSSIAFTLAIRADESFCTCAAMPDEEMMPLMGPCSYNATQAAEEKIPLCVGTHF